MGLGLFQGVRFAARTLTKRWEGWGAHIGRVGREELNPDPKKIGQASNGVLQRLVNRAVVQNENASRNVGTLYVGVHKGQNIFPQNVLARGVVHAAGDCPEPYHAKVVDSNSETDATRSRRTRA